MCWRVLTGLHKSIEINFMVAGHTKFALDLNFGLLKRRLRRTDVNCLMDIQQACVYSGKSNYPIKNGNEDGSASLLMYKWRDFFVSVRPIPGMSRGRYFKVQDTDPGILFHSVEVPTRRTEIPSL